MIPTVVLQEPFLASTAFVYWVREANPHTVLFNRDFVIYTYIWMSVCLWETHTKNTYAKMRRRNYVAQIHTCMLKVSFGGLKLTCDIHIIHFYYTLEQL